MRWWHPAEDESEQEAWWVPLRAVARRAEADRFGWPVLVGEHVVLGRVDRRGLASVWVYSHRRGGGLIRADERGRTYLVRGGRHVEVSVRRALWAAGLPDVTERPRRRHLRLVPSAGGEGAEVGDDAWQRTRQRLHVLVGGRPADGDPEGP